MLRRGGDRGLVHGWFGIDTGAFEQEVDFEKRQPCQRQPCRREARSHLRDGTAALSSELTKQVKSEVEDWKGHTRRLVPCKAPFPLCGYLIKLSFPFLRANYCTTTECGWSCVAAPNMHGSVAAMRHLFFKSHYGR